MGVCCFMSDGVVYTIDENDQIVSEKHMDFDAAVNTFYGKRDHKGRRYYISVEGKDIPFKYKRKILSDGKKSTVDLPASSAL